MTRSERTATITVNCPELTIVKDAVLSPVNAGDTLSFTITVRNIGVGTAYNVELFDVLPAGITGWTVDNDDCGIVDGELHCEFGDLLFQQTETVTITGTTDAADCGEVPNTATATADNFLNRNEVRENWVSDDATVTVECPDLDIEKVAGPTPVNAGDPITFTVTITNSGRAMPTMWSSPTPCRPASAGRTIVKTA